MAMDACNSLSLSLSLYLSLSFFLSRSLSLSLSLWPVWNNCGNFVVTPTVPKTVHLPVPWCNLTMQWLQRSLLISISLPCNRHHSRLTFTLQQASLPLDMLVRYSAHFYVLLRHRHTHEDAVHLQKHTTSGVMGQYLC